MFGHVVRDVWLFLVVCVLRLFVCLFCPGLLFVVVVVFACMYVFVLVCVTVVVL